MLDCIGYHIYAHEKGEIVAFAGENMKHIGIVISDAVDMIKEDLWGIRGIADYAYHAAVLWITEMILFIFFLIKRCFPSV